MSCPCIHAQFNTIGNVSSKSFSRQDSIPSELTDSQEDSIKPSLPTDTVDWRKEIIENYLSVSYPLRKIKINSGFGMRMHPIMHTNRMHNGLDLHARQEDVFSMLPGEVIHVGQDNRSGKYVTVRSDAYTISYCHLSRQYVRKGDFVRAGEPVGFSGSTGMSTGEHLHLTTKKDGRAIDPTILLEYVRNVKDRCVELLSQ